MVIPLRHQLVYTDDGSLDDLASWTQTLSQGGRLRSLVDFGASSGDRTVNWVVDPALIDAVRRLADGNPPRSLAPNLEVGQEDGEDEASADPSASTTPTEAPTETPTAEAGDRSRQPARPGRARPGRAGGRPGREGLAGPVGRGDASRGPGHGAAVRRRRRGRRGDARPAALRARGGPRRHDAAGLRRHDQPGAVLAERLPDRAGDPERRTGLDDPAHRRDVRGAGPRPRRHRGPQRGRHLDRRRRGRPGPGQPDVDHRDAAAAAVGSRGAVPPAAARSRSPWWSRTTGTPRTEAVRSSAASTRPGST